MSKKKAKSSPKSKKVRSAKQAKKTIKKAAKRGSKKVSKSTKKGPSKLVKTKQKLAKKPGAKKKQLVKPKPKKVVKKITKKKVSAAKKSVISKKAAAKNKTVVKPLPKKEKLQKAKYSVKQESNLHVAIKPKQEIKTKPAKAPKANKVVISPEEIREKVASTNLPSLQKAQEEKLKSRTELKIYEEKKVPEPKGRFELEYVVHSSAPILFEFLTSPSGLSEWFCDDVNIRNGIYTFIWENSQQQAKVLRELEDKMIRFQWLEKQDGSYFEFRIERDDLTNDISLIIVDFAETDEEKNSSKLLWDSQVDKLLHVLGSYF